MLSGFQWIAVVAVGGWAAIVLYRMHLVGKWREQIHRERLAMIEKGLVPPPEADSQRLDAMMDWHPSTVIGGDQGAHSRRTGVILIGVGVGLSLMLYALGTGRVMGVGVLLVVLGVAFLINAMFDRRSLRKDAGVQPPSA